ncbi:MAG: hypothetical protein PHO30_03110 [Candidatus Omnitrophica bacterium]|nr:hypothetical protein [Candidatus Omnitrophota bacterium]
MSDPYTYAAYRQSKRLAAEMESALRQSSRVEGMIDTFAGIATLDNETGRENPALVNLAILAEKGVKIGRIDSQNVFTAGDIDGEEIEINWVKRRVTADYRIDGQTVRGRVRAIFNLGRIIDEPIGIPEQNDL